MPEARHALVLGEDRTCVLAVRHRIRKDASAVRSEEHTSELQSPDHLVCRLLLEKKKKDIQLRYGLIGIDEAEQDQRQPRPPRGTQLSTPSPTQDESLAWHARRAAQTPHSS